MGYAGEQREIGEGDWWVAAQQAYEAHQDAHRRVNQPLPIQCAVPWNKLNRRLQEIWVSTVKDQVEHLRRWKRWI